MEVSIRSKIISFEFFVLCAFYSRLKLLNGNHVSAVISYRDSEITGRLFDSEPRPRPEKKIQVRHRRGQTRVSSNKPIFFALAFYIWTLQMNSRVGFRLLAPSPVWWRRQARTTMGISRIKNDSIDYLNK